MHRVLRNGDEVSAWSERGEAEKALRSAVAAEVATERARLPSNTREHLKTTDKGLSYAPGGHVMWAVEFTVDEARGPRERLAA